MIKTVILDGYTENPGDLNWEVLESICDLIVYDRTPPELITKRIADAEIVITNKTPLSESTLISCPKLKYISVLATGYDIVDIKAASNLGITVSNVPAYGTTTVSQFAIGLLLEICHHIGAHSRSVSEGAWEKGNDWCFWDYPLIELAHKTAGIIGLGKIGQNTAKIAASLGMNVIAYDSFIEISPIDYVNMVKLNDLYALSDVIIIHCPLTDETKMMINASAIAMMKPGVIIINNARGAVINESDLSDALKSGKVAAAGLDVVSTEPIKSNNPLLEAPNCIITPHISWATKEARQRILNTTFENLKSYLNGSPINTVN